MELIRPKKLVQGQTIGVFTPSTPGYQLNPQLFENGLHNLESLGFKIKLGHLTEKRASQGYRSGTPQDRAKELMDLVSDPDVHALISTIGGSNSSSLIPYLDFEKIRQERKILCGYSDVTSLHLAILHYSGLRTIYGPAVMTWFGEYPDGDPESVNSFLSATSSEGYPRGITPFPKWSNHFRRWDTDDWKNVTRQWKPNEGWLVLSEGRVETELMVVNLSTLMSAAGTSYFPNLRGRILLLESMSAPWSTEERHLRQLQLMGVFDEIQGLIIGKPEAPNSQGAQFSLESLLLEIVGKRPYPIVSQFDCSHTLPMHTLGQCCKVRLEAKKEFSVCFEILDSFVE